MNKLKTDNMKKTVFITLLISTVFFYTIQAQITATQMGMLDFKVDQALTAADMDGTNDVTTKLQAAVDNARNSSRSLFIPSGTYKVSDQIVCVMDRTYNSIQHVVNIIGSSVKHPKIILADNTATFKSINPKAVFHYKSNNPSIFSTDWIMEGGIRAVDFDLGAGNTKAVALYWGCAQYCFIEDVNINARDGFAGLTGIGGANNLLANITVTGGQHGLYLPSSGEGATWGMQESPHNTITGCTFTNQTDVPVVLWSWGGITFIGVTIVKSSGTAILMKCDTFAPVMEFPFSMTDSKIEFTTPSASNTAIKNLLHGTVSLSGVYVKGAGIICNSSGDENLTAILFNDWTDVKRYNYVDKNPRAGQPTDVFYTGIHYNAVTGVQYKTAVIYKDPSAPPADLTSRHIWASTPSFEDPDAVLVPAGSTAAQIQSAINSNTKVCLAKGTYTLSAPITLKSNTIFFGCPGFGRCGSILTYGFTPSKQTWLIDTENSATATTYLMDICTNPGNANYLGSLHWQAGRNSIIRTVHFDTGWDSYERDMIRMYFSGNGGGRVFNYQDEKNLDGVSSLNSINHRKVKVSGTSQQLTFYGLNLERGGSFQLQSSFPCIEMASSSNVRIFGGKCEVYQPYAKIDNCKNVLLTNIIDSGHLNSNGTTQDLIEVAGNSDNIEISNSFWLNPPNTGGYKIVDDPWNANEPDRKTTHIGLCHRNWTSFDGDSLTTSVVIHPSTLGNWTIFPNPTNSGFYIKSRSGMNSIVQGYISNVLGEIIRTFAMNLNETNKIDLSTSARGIYSVIIQNPTGQKDCYKVIKN